MPSFVTSPDSRRLLRTSCAVFFSVLGLCGGALWLTQAQDVGLMQLLSQNVPLGVEHHHAVLPSFDKDGKQSSLMTADIARRVDDRRLYAEGFVMEQYAPYPKRNLRIDLITAFYDLQKSTLRSTERSRVSRADFQIEGDSLIYDTVSGRGMMQGNIHMVIFDTNSKSSEETPRSAAPASQP
jgi:hypothetical protein